MNIIQFHFPVEAWKAMSQAKICRALSLTGKTEGVHVLTLHLVIARTNNNSCRVWITSLSSVWKQMLPSLTTARHHIVLWMGEIQNRQHWGHLRCSGIRSLNLCSLSKAITFLKHAKKLLVLQLCFTFFDVNNNCYGSESNISVNMHRKIFFLVGFTQTNSKISLWCECNVRKYPWKNTK